MRKTCVFKSCRSCSVTDRTLTFTPFPKPARTYEKCLRWLEIVNRKDLHINNINRYRYVCGKHFKNGKGPTEEDPDPEGNIELCDAVANVESDEIYCTSLHDWFKTVEANSDESCENVETNCNITEAVNINNESEHEGPLLPNIKVEEPEVHVEQTEERAVHVQHFNYEGPIIPDIKDEVTEEPQVHVEHFNSEGPIIPDIKDEQIDEPEVHVEHYNSEGLIIPDIKDELTDEPEVHVQHFNYEGPIIPDIKDEATEEPEVHVEHFNYEGPLMPKIKVEATEEPAVHVEHFNYEGPLIPKIKVEVIEEPEDHIEQTEEPEVHVERTEEPEVQVEQTEEPEVHVEQIEKPEVHVEQIEKPAVHFEHNYSRADVTITDIDNLKDEYELYISVIKECTWSYEIKLINDVNNLICSKELSPGKFVTFTITPTWSVKVKVDNEDLDSSHELTLNTNFPTKSTVFTLGDLLKILYEIECWKVCEGMEIDPEVDQSQSQSQSLLSPESNSSRSSNCDLLIKDTKSERCKRCLQARKALKKRKGRLAKRTTIHKNTPHIYLTYDDLKSHLKSYSNQNKLLSDRLRRVQAKGNKSPNKRVKLDNIKTV